MTNMNNIFIHPLSDVQTEQIGNGTRIWQFCVILKGAKIGDECNICSHCFIEDDVIIGNHVTVKSGVQLWDGVRIEDDVFIGPNVAFTNDQFPRSQHYPDKFLKIVIRRGASIGANATLLPDIMIGENAMIGAGAVVTKDIPANALAVGNPARVVRYLENKKMSNRHDGYT